MSKKIKKIIFVFLLIFALPVLAYYNPGDPSGFVNDYTGTLSDQQKGELETKLSQFEAETSNEIAVVIINNLDGDVIENFAVDLFADWGIGKGGKDNGVLILVAKDDREMRIEVGYGMEGSLTDAQSWQIINNIMTSAFKNGEYYQGIDGAVDGIIAATKGEFVAEPVEESSAGNNWEVIFYFVIFGFMWLASLLGKSKSWWAGGVIGGIAGIIIGIIKGFLYFGFISMAILIPFGLLFDFIVSKNYQKARAGGHYPWWIGGGRGGGSGFGGGFGGFGGGMSGGGGASGRW